MVAGAALVAPAAALDCDVVVSWIVAAVVALAGMMMMGWVLLTESHINLARRQLDVYLAESRASAQVLKRDLQTNPAELTAYCKDALMH
jgi:hypothetical protein